MAGFVKGDVVVLPFPFTDLSANKKRPALVLARLENDDDLILCMITSRSARDSSAIALGAADFTSGALPRDSSVRPNRLFTAESSIILRTAGHISDTKTGEVVREIVRILS